MKNNLECAWHFMTEYWRFVKQYYDPCPEESYWRELINDSDKLVRKYDHDDLAKRLVYAFLDYIEVKRRVK